MNFKQHKIVLIVLGVFLITIGLIGNIANNWKDFWVGLMFICPGIYLIIKSFLINGNEDKNEESYNISENVTQSNIICPQCNSNNINIQLITESQLVNSHHSFLWWILIGWWWVFIKWFFFTLPALIFKIFGIGKRKIIINKTHKMAVCQSCGNSWEIEE